LKFKIFIHQLPTIYRSSSNSFIYPIVKNGRGIYSNSREYYESTKKTALFAGLEGDYEGCSNKENIRGVSDISKPDPTEEAFKNRSTSLWEQWIKERDQHLIKSEKGKIAMVLYTTLLLALHFL
jgi:hypothetical protein